MAARILFVGKSFSLLPVQSGRLSSQSIGKSFSQAKNAHISFEVANAKTSTAGAIAIPSDRRCSKPFHVEVSAPEARGVRSRSASVTYRRRHDAITRLALNADRLIRPLRPAVCRQASSYATRWQHRGYPRCEERNDQRCDWPEWKPGVSGTEERELPHLRGAGHDPPIALPRGLRNVNNFRHLVEQYCELPAARLRSSKEEMGDPLQ